MQDRYDAIVEKFITEHYIDSVDIAYLIDTVENLSNARADDVEEIANKVREISRLRKLVEAARAVEKCICWDGKRPWIREIAETRESLLRLKEAVEALDSPT